MNSEVAATAFRAPTRLRGQFIKSAAVVASNDDWRSTQEQEIVDSTVPPNDNRESAIVTTLAPGGYTAIVRGRDGTTGVALVEVYLLK